MRIVLRQKYKANVGKIAMHRLFHLFGLTSALFGHWIVQQKSKPLTITQYLGLDTEVAYSLRSLSTKSW